MNRASNAFSVLQAIAAIASLALILWSLGLPSLRFAEAASLSTFSITLSDSAPSVAADHTVSFVTPSGMSAGDTITITFPTGDFGSIAALDFEDLDLAINGTDQTLVAGAGSGASWGVTTAANTIEIESGTTAIGTNATVTIEIGINATFGATGNTRITNPATTTSYEILVDVGTSTDSGATRVAIVDAVTVTASVDTVFTFEVTGVGIGQAVGGFNTGHITTATSVPFGTLANDNATTAAQDLTVSTNAANGFVVTAQVDQQLTSNTADIDGFRNGEYDSTPVPWEGLTPILGSENTYGHWGLTTTDPTTGVGLTNQYLSGDGYVSASTTPVEVFRHNGSANGTGSGTGTARVGYTVEISALQEAGEYTATLTYVATPVF